MNYPTDLLASYPYREVMRAGGFWKAGRPALTGIDPARIAPYVLLMVNDPLLDDGCSAQRGAEQFLSAPELTGKSGLCTAYTGSYRGTEVTLLSCGSGGPEAEIALVELMEHTGAHTFLRVGGAGGISTRRRPGFLAIASGVVRDEGLTREYITPSFPAVSSYEVVTALVRAAERCGVDYAVGIGRSTDSEHLAVGRPSVHNYFQPRHAEILDYYHRAGVLYTDRESAAIVGLCSLLGYRGGAVCAVTNNLLTGEVSGEEEAQERVLEVALEGICLLAQMDGTKRGRSREYWFPELEQTEGRHP